MAKQFLSGINVSMSLAAATSGDGLVLVDPTLAAVGAQQFSPRLRLTGQGWATTPVASQTVDWICEVKPVQGTANPSSLLVFSAQVNGGGYTARLTVSSGGSTYSVIAGNAQVSGVIQITGAGLNLLAGTVFISTVAPTIASGFGTSPSVTHNNGPSSFSVNVGTGGTATSGVITLPAATNGWSCFASDVGATPTGRTEPTAMTTTSVTLTNYSRTTGAPIAWTASEIIQVSCFAN